MYEEVCLLCGRPVTVDGRVYCSDECESLDATSPSISTTSSAYPSPYLHSNNGPGSLADVPALVSSAMGRSPTAGSSYKIHKNRHSISSSSTSSVACSVFTDDEEADFAGPSLAVGVEDEFGYSRELLGVDGGSKTAGFLGQYYGLRPSGLSYARRPSGTNQRATIPTLNRRTSSMSSPSASGTGSPRSAPVPSNTFEDDFSDVPSGSVSPLPPSRPRHGRKSSGAFSHSSSDQERDPETTITSKSRRNRASLPAYFSLLTTSTSSSSAHSQRVPSSLQTLTAITRSFQSSPPTPRVAYPTVDPISAYSHGFSIPQAVEASPRGRGRQRDPNARSMSSRRSEARSPPRQSVQPRASGSPPACAHHYAHVGPNARARLDSIEKVADWVSHSPVMQARGRTLTRRNSSPSAKPRFEEMLPTAGSDNDVEAVREVLARSLHFYREAPSEGVHASLGREDSGRARGRRRVEELDEPPRGVDHRVAPGFGNGRSGLRTRERSRGRTVAR